jgi:hypothetical protein
MATVTPPSPLTETDDRSQFDCGRDSLNNWFQQRAWANHAVGVSRTNVICDATTNEIVGYVTLSVAQIERAFLPKPLQRNKPDPVPVTLLGQLAIHKAEARSRALAFAFRAQDGYPGIARDRQRWCFHAPDRRYGSLILSSMGLPGSALRSSGRHDCTHGRHGNERRSLDPV